MMALSRLLCIFGRHAPSPSQIANQCYLFSRCRRCDREIVRSAFSGWRTPGKRFRIVWSPTVVEAGSKAERAYADWRRRAASASADFMAGDGLDFDWAPGAIMKPKTVPAERTDFMAETTGREKTSKEEARFSRSR